MSRLVRSQPHHHRRNIIRQPPQRNTRPRADPPRRPQLPRLIGNTADHPRLRAGRNRIGRHPITPHIPRHHPSKTRDPILRRSVIRLPRIAVQPRRRTESNNPPGTLLPEQHRRILDHRKRTLQMHRNNIVPFLFRHIKHHPVAQNPRHRNHNIQLAETVQRGLHHLFPAVHTGDIFRASRRLPAQLADFRHHRIRHRHIGARPIHIHPQIAHHHPRPLSRHQMRHPPPDTAPGPGYDRNFVFQQIRHYSRPFPNSGVRRPSFR